MQSKRTLSLLGTALGAAGLLAMLPAGCSDDGPGTFSSGVDPGKPLGSLSPSELASICKAVEAWVNGPLEKQSQAFGCKVAGVFAGALAPAAQKASLCKMAVDQCLMQPSMMSGGMNMCEPPPAGCTATVGEAEACLNELPKALEDAAKAIPSCDNLGSMIPNVNVADPFATSAACKTVEMKCPGTFMP